jgi:hypothetical protein
MAFMGLMSSSAVRRVQRRDDDIASRADAGAEDRCARCDIIDVATASHGKPLGDRRAVLSHGRRSPGRRA